MPKGITRYTSLMKMMLKKSPIIRRPLMGLSG